MLYEVYETLTCMVRTLEQPIFKGQFLIYLFTALNQGRQ